MSLERRELGSQKVREHELLAPGGVGIISILPARIEKIVRMNGDTSRLHECDSVSTRLKAADEIVTAEIQPDLMVQRAHRADRVAVPTAGNRRCTWPKDMWRT